MANTKIPVELSSTPGIVDNSNATAITIDSSERVGIGTTSPSYQLDVENSTSASDNSTISVVSGTSGYAQLLLGDTESDARGYVVYQNSNDSLQIASGGSERMRIDSSGNVGIGTSSPQKALDIAGASSSGGAVMRLSGTGEASQGNVTGAIQFYSADTTDNTPGVFGIIRGIAGASGGEGSLQILTDMPSEGADANNITMHFNANGNVGIGTSSPSYKTDIQNSGDNILQTTGVVSGGVTALNLRQSRGSLASPTNSASNGDGNYIVSQIYRASAYNPNAWIGLVTDSATDDGRIVFGTASSGTVAERMRIDSSGNATFNNAVNITGDLNIASTIAHTGDLDTYLQFNAADTFRIVTAGSERMRIDSSGNLLLGTTSTAFRGNHTIASSSAFSTSIVQTQASAGASILNLDFSAATPNNTSDYFIFAEDASAARFVVRANGNVENVNNSYGALSDEKLKENIVDATDKLEDLKQVKVRNYNLIGNDKKQIGVIAQELETIFPNMVEETPDLDDDNNDLGTTTKSVKYSVFVPILIKAIQEQQAQIEALQSEINLLKGE